MSGELVQPAVEPFDSRPDPAHTAGGAEQPHPETVHGETRDDDYFWLREKSEPRGARLPRGRERLHRRGHEADRGAPGALYQEMLGRIKETDLTVPYREGGYCYYSRTEEGKQYPILLPQAGAASTRPRRSCST